MDNIHTKETFDRVYSDRDWNFYRGLLSNCIEYGLPGKWLDLGAGLGYFVECAQRFGMDCDGIEGCEYAVNKAKERYPGLKLRKGFLEERLPFEDNSIATIILNQAIEHISSETAKHVLKESFRVLVPGGVVFIYSPSIFNPEEKFEKTHINLYSPKILQNEVEIAGFKVIVAPNFPIYFLGSSRILRAAVNIFFKSFPFDYLSATANCIAKKPVNS